ncbi:MAG: UbiD family decarboxylase [Steroidobacteraceae bacterium]
MSCFLGCINEYDGGFYIDKANVVSRDPCEPANFNKQNVGIYRIQVHGPDLLSLDAVPSHDMGRQIRMAEKHNLPLKIAVMIGNHPAMAMFAATPLDYDESEFAYAARMMGSPLQLTTSGNGMDILANAEMVIEAEMINGKRIHGGRSVSFRGPTVSESGNSTSSVSPVSPIAINRYSRVFTSGARGGRSTTLCWV